MMVHYLFEKKGSTYEKLGELHGLKNWMAFDALLPHRPHEQLDWGTIRISELTPAEVKNLVEEKDEAYRSVDPAWREIAEEEDALFSRLVDGVEYAVDWVECC